MLYVRKEQTRITRDMLEPGDHINRYGKGSSYTHHGIYVGKEMVIHYTRTEPDGREVTSTISSSSSNHNSDSNPCPKCNYKIGLHRGVVKTCLDCFLSGQNHIYLYEYGLPVYETLFNPNPGGTTVHCRPPSQVLGCAFQHLGKRGFGKYNLIFNNCEDFAYYCKTGVPGSFQIKFLVLYMMTIGFLLATEPFVVFSVKFIFRMLSLSLLEFDIRVILFALIQLLQTLGPFFEIFGVVIAIILFDSDITIYLVSVFAICSKYVEFAIYVTFWLIYIKFWLELKLCFLAIFVHTIPLFEIETDIKGKRLIEVWSGSPLSKRIQAFMLR
ncbi:LRAT domain [Dillenia turbinata]|uniref:LRAT domain n=1 Tax=Dillenia turbinata TaxID=194707 RepID=A0AAN8UPS4_9MAGN